MRHVLLLIAVAAALCGLVTAPAGASPVTIDGSPLQLTLTDRGGVAVQRNGAMWQELAGAAGFVFFPFAEAAPFGASYNVVTTTAAPSLSGTGTAGDPFVATVEYEPAFAVAGVHVMVRLTYVDGDDRFLLQATVHNTGAADRTMRAAVLARTRVGASDLAWGDTGALNGTRYVAAVNDVEGAYVAFGEIPGSPWLSFEEDAAEELGIHTIMNGMWKVGGMFHNRVNTGWTKAMLGADFAPGVLSGIPAGATQSYAIGVEIGAFDALTLTAPDGSRTAGSAVAVDVQARNHGDALAGRLVRYAITGANPQTGSVTTTAAGTGAISWTGTRPGTDTLHAYLDTNGNGTEDDDEAADDVALTFAAPPAVTPTPTPTVAPSPPSNRITALAPQLRTRTGGAVLRLRVPGAGKLDGVATARIAKRTTRIATFSATAKAAGTVRVALKPNRTALRTLRRSGRLATTVKVKFTPVGGAPRTISLHLVLRLVRAS